MDLERAARESGIVRPEHLDALLRSLRSTDFRWIVCNPSQTEERLQGDLVSEMPVALIDAAGMVRSRQLSVMVLNNACDLQRGRSRFITLAPVRFPQIRSGHAKKRSPKGEILPRERTRKSH